MKSIYDLATEAGVELPPATKPVAIYRSYVWDEDRLYVSGQVPMINGEVRYRDNNEDLPDVKIYQEAARICGLNILAQVGVAIGGRECASIKCLKITGFVAANRAFTEHPKVVNGASDLIGRVLGEDGHHARSAVGVISLPSNALVEVEALFRIRFAS